MYEACIELKTRAGNINLPELPRCGMQAFLLDSRTQVRVPIKFECTNIVRLQGKTCGSLQWLSVADMLLWSSFEPERFTLYVERASKSSDSTSVLHSQQLCK